jgi:hypothetical protein
MEGMNEEEMLDFQRQRSQVEDMFKDKDSSFYPIMIKAA